MPPPNCNPLKNPKPGDGSRDPQGIGAYLALARTGREQQDKLDGLFALNFPMGYLVPETGGWIGLADRQRSVWQYCSNCSTKATNSFPP